MRIMLKLTRKNKNLNLKKKRMMRPKRRKLEKNSWWDYKYELLRSRKLSSGFFCGFREKIKNFYFLRQLSW